MSAIYMGIFTVEGGRGGGWEGGRGGRGGGGEGDDREGTVQLATLCQNIHVGPCSPSGIFPPVLSKFYTGGNFQRERSGGYPGWVPFRGGHTGIPPPPPPPPQLESPPELGKTHHK